MKSHRNAGQANLHGKKSKTLRCGCCTVEDLRDRYAKQIERRDMQERIEDDYSEKSMSQKLHERGYKRRPLRRSIIGDGETE